MSSCFKLSKGIRQGCHISALLFLLIAEIADIIIRATNDIRGVTVNEVTIKMCQLADDITLFLTSSKSVYHNIFEEFLCLP